MSWRTNGLYKGLSKADKKWLKKFDRKWDTKAEGRSREDAFDHMKADNTPAIRPKSHRRRPKLAAIPAPDQDEVTPDQPESSPEVAIALLAREVLRFTVPKPPRSPRGEWKIHLVLKSGEEMRVHFKDQESAIQAYQILQEASSILLAG